MEREQVLAFRLTGHHLDRRLPEGSLLEAVSVCGIRSTQGTPLSAIQARVAGIAQSDIDDALTTKRLVETLSARTGAALVPANDLDVFTLGVLPGDEESLRAALKPFLPTFDPSGMRSEEALELACAAALDALSAGPLTWPELAAEMTRRLPEPLCPPCRGRCPDPHVEEILFRLVSVHGMWCFLPGAGSLVRTDQWLGRFPDEKDRHRFRAELLRRYLSCNGPSTTAEFAVWAGISNADAKRSITDLRAELIEVRVGKRKRAWILERDGDRLRSATPTKGVRFLPRNDPYLQGRDRETILPDRAAHRLLWRATASPGGCLADGELVGAWRARKKGKRLEITIQPFGKLARSVVSAMEEEAQFMAEARGCESAQLSWPE